MKNKHLLLLLLISFFAVTSLAEEFTVIPASYQDIERVRDGGFVLFLRHGPTDSAQPDHVPVDLDDCLTQRPLTDEGRLLMDQVGKAIAQVDIPLGNIHTSPLCRAVETTEIVFSERPYIIEDHLMYVAALTTQEKAPIIARTHALLVEAVPAGENRVLVAHGPNLVEVMDYFPVEGALVIFKPDVTHQRFEYISTIEPDHWSTLLSRNE